MLTNNLFLIKKRKKHSPVVISTMLCFLAEKEGFEPSRRLPDLLP